jgi:PAS domain S-box-containing protein
VSQARAGIVIGDEAGQVTYANAAFAAMTGLGGDDLPVRALADIPLRTAEGTSLVDAIAAAGQGQGRLLLTRVDEPTVQLEALAAPLPDADGRVRDQIIVLRDVTRERQLEARVR